MRHGSLNAAFVAAVLIFMPAGQPANATQAIEIQWPGSGYQQDWPGRREHCGRMIERFHEIRDRIGYAPPWQRDELEHRAFELRQRLRYECWGHWRD